MEDGGVKTIERINPATGEIYEIKDCFVSKLLDPFHMFGELIDALRVMHKRGNLNVSTLKSVLVTFFRMLFSDRTIKPSA